MKTKLLILACLLSAIGGYQLHVQTAEAVVIDRPFEVETRIHDCRIAETALQVAELPALKPVPQKVSYVMNGDVPQPKRKGE